jgi:Sperm-tail PG-rich repeat
LLKYRDGAVFYDLQDTKTKRATGLGYGRRFDSLLNPATLASPSPNRYTLESTFQRAPKSRAFSFGLSRDHFKKVYIKENPQVDASVPGPGQYDHTASMKLMQGVMYSLRPKTTKDSSFQNFTKHFPGPGTYELNATEDKNGFCFVSKYKSSTGTKINAITPGNHNAS